MTNCDASIPSASRKVLSASTIRILQARGDEARLVNGSRMISNSSYMPPGSIDYSRPAHVIIPDELNSIETLQFLELDNPTAQKIWNMYCDDLIHLPQHADILLSAKQYITRVSGNTLISNDERHWRRTMKQMGLSADYQNRIMAGEHTGIRLKTGLQGSVFGMMDTRFGLLCSLNKIIRTRPSTTIPCRCPPAQVAGHAMYYCACFVQNLDRYRVSRGQLRMPPPSPASPFDINPYAWTTSQARHAQALQGVRWGKANAGGDVVPIVLLHIAFPLNPLGKQKVWISAIEPEQEVAVDSGLGGADVDVQHPDLAEYDDYHHDRGGAGDGDGLTDCTTESDSVSVKTPTSGSVTMSDEVEIWTSDTERGHALRRGRGHGSSLEQGWEAL
ncbi:MAG: hypothetical protein M1819_002754 [Sarea resinae]|nr:MAG: hypothetical protein M1819_002754 [Sarea resinae]